MTGDRGTAEQAEERETGTVGLEYRSAVEDHRAALRVRLRVSKADRPWRLTPVIAGALVAVHVLLSLGSGTPVSRPLIGGLALCAVLPLVLLSVLLRLQAREMHQAGRRRGVHRVTVADTGLTTVDAVSSAEVAWNATPRYRETPELFLLLSEDRNVSCCTVLPKRGAARPADVDRLRAVLDRHLTRV
ncbi:YcxB family protein [Streptomyces sp. CRN 30]|uniref:YcxB family protein n=1 Tax=Streptomyces sp. CRN 30 TaxID=3075613 RepID=UPI002A800BCD|nr:YcxB family protein [Streptomyces sp. CRN 30]